MAICSHARTPEELENLRFGLDQARRGWLERGDLANVACIGANVTERVHLREELRMMAVRDELTGLTNRRGFLTLADQQLKMALREKLPLLLVFIDMDGLKAINDELGHAVGDWSSAREFSDREIATSQDPRLLLCRGLLEYELGNYQDAQEYLERVLEVVTLTPAGPTIEHAPPPIYLGHWNCVISVMTLTRSPLPTFWPQQDHTP